MNVCASGWKELHACVLVLLGHTALALQKHDFPLQTFHINETIARTNAHQVTTAFLDRTSRC